MASSSKEMELAIKIAGKVESSFTSALGTAGKGIASLTKTLTAATAAAAAAVGAIAVAAVNVGKEFETAMSQVKATMLIDTGTEEGMAAYETLENAARECGRSTAFSATEAAEALNNLAMAGYDVEKSTAALPTVLNLAGAGTLGLQQAAEMLTAGMASLGIEQTEEKFQHFADVLAITASKAKTDVAGIGEAITTVGGTAANLKGGTEEVAAALGILADVDLTGSEGGTHLRNMILALQNPRNADAAKMFQNLGVAAYDSEGKMRGLNEIFGDLSKSMEGMTQEQKDSVLSTIFKQTDLAAANAMLENCGERFEELYDAAYHSSEGIGAAAEMYRIQTDNLEGDIAILKSGLADLGISIYKDLNAPLRSMTQLATNMVTELSNAYSDGGLEGMVGSIGGCLAEATNVIADYTPQVVSMGVNLISSFVGGIAANAGALSDVAAEALTVFVNGLFLLVPQVLLAGIDIVTQFAASITSQLPGLINNGTLAITNFVSGIVQRLPIIISTALTLIQTLVSSIGANAPMLIASAVLLIGNLAMGLVSMLPQLLQMGIQLILSLAQGIISNLPLILQMGVQIIVSLVNGLVSMIPMIIQGGIQLIIGLIQGIIQNLPTIVQAAVQIVMALIMGLISAIPQLVAAVPQLLAAIWNAIVHPSPGWGELGGQIIDGIKEGFMSGFTAMIDSVKGLWGKFKSWVTGDDGDDSSAEASGQAMASSYANGIASNSEVANAAANSMIASSFAVTDYTAATAAGAEGAIAYTTGIENGLASFTPDMSAMGFDTSSLTANLNTAGTESATALMTSLENGIGSYALDASSIGIDTSSLLENLTAIGTEGATSISSGLESGSLEVTTAATMLTTDVNSALDTGWDTAKSSAESALGSLINIVQAKAQEAANAVKSAFENMTITIPKPRIPVISVSTSSVSYGEGGSVSVPNFSVSWNALGGIFGKPTILNTANNGLQGVGEAGAEAVLPLDTLWSKMKTILTDAIKQSSGIGIIEAMLQRLQGIGSSGGGGGGAPELAGAGGPNITYAPVYHLHGSATTDDAVKAEKLSQAEFNRMIKQWQKENNRTKF